MKDNIEIDHAATEHGEFTTVVTDRKAGRAWSGIGKTLPEASTEAVRKMLSDRRSREYVP